MRRIRSGAAPQRPPPFVLLVLSADSDDDASSFTVDNWLLDDFAVGSSPTPTAAAEELSSSESMSVSSLSEHEAEDVPKLAALEAASLRSASCTSMPSLEEEGFEQADCVEACREAAPAQCAAPAPILVPVSVLVCPWWDRLPRRLPPSRAPLSAAAEEGPRGPEEVAAPSRAPAASSGGDSEAEAALEAEGRSPLSRTSDGRPPLERSEGGLSESPSGSQAGSVSGAWRAPPREGVAVPAAAEPPTEEPREQPAVGPAPPAGVASALAAPLSSLRRGVLGLLGFRGARRSIPAAAGPQRASGPALSDGPALDADATAVEAPSEAPLSDCQGSQVWPVLAAASFR
jgi:hypothetical protein